MTKWDYKKRLEDAQAWKMPESEKAAIKVYASEFANGRITRKIPNKPDATIETVLDRLKVFLEGTNKSFDMAVFKPVLESRKEKGTPGEEAAKTELKALYEKKPEPELFNKGIKELCNKWKLKEVWALGFIERLQIHEALMKQYEEDKKIYLSDESLKTFVDDLRADKYKVQILKWVGEKPKQELKRVGVKPFTPTGKKRIIEYAKTYISFRYNDAPEDEARLLKILDVKFSIEQKEPKVLSREQVILLRRGCNLAQAAYILCNIFGGLRAGEFHTIQMQGMRLPNDNQRWLEIDIIESKTKTRTIKIYDPEASQTIIDYYHQREREGAKPQDKFYPKNHSTMRQWLGRYSKKTLGIHVNPHMFRSTGVTLNADSGIITSDTDLNKFYGWKPGTGTSRRYLDMQKLTLKNIDAHADIVHAAEKQKEELKKNLELDSLNQKLEANTKAIQNILSFLANIKDPDDLKKSVERLNNPVRTLYKEAVMS